MDTMKSDMLGSHLSVAGGYVNALREAERLDMQTVQIFTKNQRQWKASPMDLAAVGDWLTELHRLKWTQTVSHASYLINLATPADEHFEKSIDSMTDEVERAEALEVRYVVVHPGSSLDSPEQDGIARLVKALDEITRRTRGFNAVICLETTVGGGNQIGGRFEHLGVVRERLAEPQRVGTCFDTCHVTAAGYDLSTAKAARAVFEHYDAIVGLEHLLCFHLNDSKFPCGSHRDRHEHIGLGEVGLPCFEHIMRSKEFADRPKILETEKAETDDGTAWDTINLRRLRALADNKRSAPTAPPQPAARTGEKKAAKKATTKKAVSARQTRSQPKRSRKTT